MVVRVATVAFEGIEARPVDVQVQLSTGDVKFNVVGLADKAVAESRERVRAALNASGLALPARRITVNLAPADMPKEGSHYDLPIALGVMAAIGAIPSDALNDYTIIGELALDGTITPVAGALPAAVAANARGHVRAKTGWIDKVYALAGQIDSRSGLLNFVVVARGKVGSTAMAAIDNLVAGIYKCGSNLASF